MKKDILWFYISMDNIQICYCTSSLEQLLKDYSSLQLCKRFLWVKVCLKSTSIAVFINKVDVILCLKHFNEFYYIVAFKLLQSLNFIKNNILQLRHTVKFLEFKHLDCSDFVSHKMSSLVNISKLARSDFFLEKILFNNFCH
jgi:hypothetical protein